MRILFLNENPTYVKVKRLVTRLAFFMRFNIFLTQLLPVFAGRVELHFRPAFLGEAQVHAGVGQIRVVAVHIFRQAICVGVHAEIVWHLTK